MRREPEITYVEAPGNAGGASGAYVVEFDDFTYFSPVFGGPVPPDNMDEYKAALLRDAEQVRPK